MSVIKSLAVYVGLVAALFATTGCTTTQATKAHPLKPIYGEGVDLARFDVAIVQPFEVATAKPADAAVGATLVNAIAKRLEYDFGPLFQTVRVGQPTGDPNEVVVTGRITEYQPGSRAARLLGPGIGKAELEGELVVKDARTDQALVIAPIDKLWAWGHSIGAAKGMEDMLEESAAAAANMIARAKGWKPVTQVSYNR
jgi:hypothetical protein